MSEERQAKLQRLIEAAAEAHYAESALAETADSSTLEAYGDLRQLAGEYAAARETPCINAAASDWAGYVHCSLYPTQPKCVTCQNLAEIEERIDGL